MIVKFADLDCMSMPTMVLRNLDGTAIQTLGYAFNIELDLNYNEVSTLSFQLPKYVDGKKTPHYDEVVGMRIVDILGCGQFMLVDPQESNDEPKCIKTCKAYSLEYEFAKKNIYLEGGTYNFFDGANTSNPDTIIGRILERMPDWTAEIDDALIGKYRTFDDINKKVYDFIKSDLQQKYGCIFDFDTYTREIHVRSVDTPVSQKPVYLSSDALIKKLDIQEDSESIVTCLDVYGADGVDIRSVNPTGTNKIYNLDYFMNTVNFSQDMIDKWHAWEAAVEAAQDEYYQITISYNMKLMDILSAQADAETLNTELQVLINERATTIAYQNMGSTLPAGVRTLAEVNAAIAAKEAEIAAKNTEIEGLRSEALSIDEDRQEINEDLAFSEFFTESELEVLNRYFIEDTLEDNSFVMRNVITYDAQELNVNLSLGTVISISGPTNGITQTESGERVFSDIANSTITLQVGGKQFTGNIVRGTMYNQDPGDQAVTVDFTLTAYLSGGSIGDAAFGPSNLTITGSAAIPPSSEYPIQTLNLKTESSKLYFTENATEYERHQVEWELYEHAHSVLMEHASPTYNFTVDAINFLALDEYLAFHKALTLGERVYLNIDDEILTPYVVHVHLAFDNPTSFQIEFSSSYTSFDQSFALAKLLDQSVSMGKTLDYKSGMYSAFVNSGASSSVKNFMDSALDVAKNRVLSSGQQAITYDDTGLRLRKWEDGDHDSYDPEEIWAVNNMIVFTDDAWESAGMAIGKIFDPNLQGKYQKTRDHERDESKTYYTDASGTQWDSSGTIPWSTNLYELNSTGMAYGVAAPYIVGTLLAGQNLVIDSVKPDGTNSVFRVDGSGASLYNASFTISNGRGQVVLDPELGIGVGNGTGGIISDNGITRQWDESKTKFWVDTNGNLHFAGTLEGATGIFSGELKVGGTSSLPNFWVKTTGELRIGPDGTYTSSDPNYNFVVDSSGNVTANNLTANNGTFDGIIKAKDIQFPNPNAYGGWTSVLTNLSEYGEATSSSKVGPNYLELKGISVIDDSDPFNPRTTFHVDGLTGNVTMSGSLLADGSISATTITASTMRGGDVMGAKFYATGEGRSGDTAFYVCNQYENPNNPSSPLSPTYIDGYIPYRIGYLSYDSQTTPDTKYSAKYRMLLKTTGVYSRTSDEEYPYAVRGLALKLESAGDISLSAGTDRPARYASQMETGSIILASRIRITTASFGPNHNSVSEPAEGQIYFETES